MKAEVKIGVFPESTFSASRKFFSELGKLFSVRFVAFDKAHGSKVNLFLNISQERAVQLAAKSRRCLAFINEGPTIPLMFQDIYLSPTPCLVGCLRGRSFPCQGINRASLLRNGHHGEILARKGEIALWLRRMRKGATLDLVATEPPNFLGVDYLFQHLQKDNWFCVLPLLHFLHEVSGWEPPPLRACFMFDDPNLHWKSYGYVNYAKLARHTAEHDYHVSFATVPLDVWHLNAKTAELFLENRSRLSLLVHGNNHTSRELAHQQNGSGGLGLAAQALQRVERLERNSKLQVSRVMAPPHGACTHEMATALLRTGFEAACISRGSIMHQNPHTAWPLSVGLNPAEFLGEGLPVIPRFRLKRGCEVAIMLASFLGQPVIPVGHHEELAEGLDLLGELADKLNSTGNVQWMDMESIARSNFCTCCEDEVLHVKMFSRKIRLKVPEGVEQVCVHRPWLAKDAEEGLALQNGKAGISGFDSYRGDSIPVECGAEIEIASVYPEMIDHHSVRLPRTPFWAVARRQLCEARDRLKPITDRLSAVAARKI